MTHPHTHRCAACGEDWWDAHVCPRAIVNAIQNGGLSQRQFDIVSAQQAALERDAARYRRLRENWIDCDELGLHGRLAAIDDRVDRALYDHMLRGVAR